MALATVDAGGLPDVRMVLLKGVDARGFVFYTNLESAKGEELAANPQAALVLPLEVACAGRCAFAGPVVPVSDAGGGRLFRHAAEGQPDRRLGVASVARRWKGALRWKRKWRATRRNMRSPSVPRPPHWSGFRVQPLADRILARSRIPPA